MAKKLIARLSDGSTHEIVVTDTDSAENALNKLTGLRDIGPWVDLADGSGRVRLAAIVAVQLVEEDETVGGVAHGQL